MNTATLEINLLSTGYGKGRHRHVVGRNLSGTLCAGSLTALIGPNGCGKSTLLRTLCGFLPALSGDVRWQGRSMAEYSPQALAQVLGIVLTTRVDSAFLSVRDVVESGRYPYTGLTGRLSDADHALVEKALQLTGTTSFASRSLVSLSDGERQRVMIAKALAQDTPVILLDEPTAFLDFPGKADILSLLAHLAHSEGKTLLLSTHDLEMAFQMADNLWLLSSDGIHSGTPRELAADGSLQHRFARSGLTFHPERLSFTFS